MQTYTSPGAGSLVSSRPSTSGRPAKRLAMCPHTAAHASAVPSTFVHSASYALDDASVLVYLPVGDVAKSWADVDPSGMDQSMALMHRRRRRADSAPSRTLAVYRH